MDSNVICETGDAKIFTLDYGWCWLFSAVEHWTAECIDWPFAKTGDRFSALQPISVAIKQRFDSVGIGVAQLLTL